VTFMTGVTIGDVERRRLRWRARRGLLENDIIVSRWLDAHEHELGVDDVLALETLLDLPDNELLDLLLARAEPRASMATPEILDLLRRLRAA